MPVILLRLIYQHCGPGSVLGLHTYLSWRQLCHWVALVHARDVLDFEHWWAEVVRARHCSCFYCRLGCLSDFLASSSLCIAPHLLQLQQHSAKRACHMMKALHCAAKGRTMLTERQPGSRHADCCMLLSTYSVCPAWLLQGGVAGAAVQTAI